MQHIGPAECYELFFMQYSLVPTFMLRKTEKHTHTNLPQTQKSIFTFTYDFYFGVDHCSRKKRDPDSFHVSLHLLEKKEKNDYYFGYCSAIWKSNQCKWKIKLSEFIARNRKWKIKLIKPWNYLTCVYFCFEFKSQAYEILQK